MNRVTVYFPGTGTAFNTDGYANQFTLIEWKNTFLAVDAGPSFLFRLEQMGLDTSKVNHILLTHFHGDHIAGIPFQVINFAILIKNDPLRITGPTGTEKRIRKLMEATYPDVDCDRWIHFQELPVEEAHRIPLGEGIFLDTYPMDHNPESLGYRITINEKKIALSGDTRWNPNLQPLFQGADLGILECTTVEKNEFAHISADEWQTGAEGLACRTMVPVHCGNDVRAAIKKMKLPGIKIIKDGNSLIL